MFFGTNPSGQNLTTYINSIVNALYIRVAYFSRYSGDFRSNVALMTYGDDFIGSVSADCPDFHFAAIRDRLSDMGIAITLPDKSGNEGTYLSEEQCDFLKRRSRYCKELGHQVGVLEEKSIIRSLMYQVQSKELPDVALVGALRSALQEWWYHGPETYELRRRDLRKIFSSFPLDVKELNLSFEDIHKTKMSC